MHAYAEEPLVEERKNYPFSVGLLGGYSTLSTPLGAVSGNSLGVGVQYQIMERLNIGVNWKQVLAQASLNALYNVWTVESAYRILGQDRATVQTVRMGSQVFARTEERGKHALFFVAGLQQLSLSTSTGGSFSGYRAGLRYEAKFFKPFWNSFDLNYSSLKSSSSSATQIEFIIRFRIPVAL